ncbi:MAG TPA: hypothetical protein VFN59_02070, partial [Acidimicrobiales bacterium]|nr:hypothetical protein [Acidimicrobiales bacterium]
LVGLVLCGALYVASVPRGATAATTPTSPATHPLYQFVDTGTQPLPWNANSLESQLQSTTMLGGPHGATGPSAGVIAYRTNADDLALLTMGASGTTTWSDLSTQGAIPAPAGDPVPFFDPNGHPDVLYVDGSGDLELVAPNDPVTPNWNRLHRGLPWRPYVALDLSALTGQPAQGLASAVVEGTSAVITYRTVTNNLEVLTLSWSPGQNVPVYSEVAATITTPSAAAVGPAAREPRSSTTTTSVVPTTTTTRPRPLRATPFSSDPVALPGPTPTVAATLANGDLAVFTSSNWLLAGFTQQNLTTLTASPPLVGPLSVGTSSATIDLAGLTAGGQVELYSTTYLTAAPGPLATASFDAWSVLNVTAAAPGAPPLAGHLAVAVTPSQVAVAGQAAHWGDLFVLTATPGTATWSATDVSVTAGASARTVGPTVTDLTLGGELTLYAAGYSAPPPQGVGVYAIPSAKWSTAIANGWPILAETGGLGTRSAPWVGFVGSPPVNESPDFLMGQAIYNAHKRVTWLSFWTVSGPLANETQTTQTYYTHGYDAGQWVATQIDSYRSLGVGLKPDWVILDPEGYPDNHSHLDAPAGATKAVKATYATYWSAMLSGWQAGLNAVDPSLNAAVYASQSEYANYGLANLSMPVFEALAFAGNGPDPIPGASGSNIRGYITFDASCTPLATLQSEAQTLENPPWSGRFNTLQFNPGVYCPPPP